MWRNAALGIVLASFFFANAGGTSVHAGELIFVDEAAPPFMYDTPQGATGICPALVHEIFSRLGEPVVIEAIPWKRILAQIETGSAGVACIRMTHERAAHLDFTDPFILTSIGVYARRGRIIDYTGIDSLKGRLVAVRRGWSYGETFDRARADGLFQIEEFDADGQILDTLLDGRIDAVVLAQATADLLISAHDASDRVVSFRDDSLNGERRIAFPKGATKGALIQRINGALAAMRADGTLEKLNAVVNRP